MLDDLFVAQIWRNRAILKSKGRLTPGAPQHVTKTSCQTSNSKDEQAAPGEQAQVHVNFPDQFVHEIAHQELSCWLQEMLSSLSKLWRRHADGFISGADLLEQCVCQCSQGTGGPVHHRSMGFFISLGRNGNLTLQPVRADS